MCKKNEYYDIDTTECLPCSECPKGDKILLECSYFGDTLCEKDVLAGFQIAPYPTPGTPSPVTRGAGTVAVEVLPEDWTTSPTVLMVVTAVCFTTLMVTIVIALYCFRRKVWSPKQEKEILYLSRPHPRHYPTVGEEERYQPLPSRDRLKKTNYFSSSIYANDSMFNMPNTHIYVNMMDFVDSDCCSNDYVDIDEHLES